jgi:hypothetical protein
MDATTESLSSDQGQKQLIDGEIATRKYQHIGPLRRGEQAGIPHPQLIKLLMHFR